jgi:hypothetical protein
MVNGELIRDFADALSLILRSRAERGVSKEEAKDCDLMVRDGASRLLTMRGMAERLLTMRG